MLRRIYLKRLIKIDFILRSGWAYTKPKGFLSVGSIPERRPFRVAQVPPRVRASPPLGVANLRLNGGPKALKSCQNERSEI